MTVKKKEQKIRLESTKITPTDGSNNFLVEVIVSKIYAFPILKSGRTFDGRTPEELVQEFFVDFDINRTHASRDSNEVGNGKKIIAIKYKLPRKKEKDHPIVKTKRCEHWDCGWCYKPASKYENGCIGLDKCSYLKKKV
jgi:hypothetical protein